MQIFGKRFLQCGCLALFLPAALMAQQLQTFDFENNQVKWNELNGHAQIEKAGAYKGNALRMSPKTKVAFGLNLQPSSTYRITVWMRTESGADDMSMQTSGLGNNDVSLTTAVAAWTKYEKTFHTSESQRKGSLEFSFERSQGNTYAWVDEIEIKRIGDYKEVAYTGIPKEKKRLVKTDLGISMQPDGKMAWMANGKLGMFVHWGLYAGPGKGEWYMENNGIKPEEYRKLAYPESGSLYFDAKHFNARKLVALAKKMGAKYMCMTTQHHDGYALFESKYMNAFTSKQTHNRDFIKEYVDACREAGLKVGLYKTLINWRFPGYYDVNGTDCKPNKFGYTTNPEHKENARLMKEELYCQTKELMTKYGKIDQLFWDGGWLGQQGNDADAAYFWEPGKYLDANNAWPVNPYFQDKEDGTGKPLGLMGMVRKHQPDIVTNIRSGWVGDYTNEEGGGAVKGGIRSGVVEKCFTLAPGWGYNKMMEDSTKIMSLKNIKRLFSDCMVRNMCCLINVGPDRHGDVPRPVEKRLIDFGKWVSAESEAIYNTKGGPWEPVDGQYGFTYNKNVVYVYFLGGFADNTFTLPPLNKGMKVTKAYNVATKESVKAKQRNGRITLKNIKVEPDDVTIFAVVLNRNVR